MSEQVHDAAGACEPGYHRGSANLGWTTCRCGKVPINPEPVQVPVTVRFTVTRIVEVTVPVEQTADIDPSSHGVWPDVPDLYDRARQLVREGEGETMAESVRVEGWRAEPSKTGDPYWRPSMFGGRL